MPCGISKTNYIWVSKITPAASKASNQKAGGGTWEEPRGPFKGGRKVIAPWLSDAHGRRGFDVFMAGKKESPHLCSLYQPKPSRELGIVHYWSKQIGLNL